MPKKTTRGRTQRTTRSTKPRTYKKTSKPSTYTKRTKPTAVPALRSQVTNVRERLLANMQYEQLTHEEKMLYHISNQTGFQIDLEPDRSKWISMEQQYLSETIQNLSEEEVDIEIEESS